MKSEKPIWPGHQNPVWYVDDIREVGIDPDALDWKKTELKVTSDESPKVSSDELEFDDDQNEAASGMTFDEARSAIAMRYRVPPKNVEIIIRG